MNQKRDVIVTFMNGSMSEMKDVHYFDIEWAIQLTGDGVIYIIPKASIKCLTITPGTGETECVL